MILETNRMMVRYFTMNDCAALQDYRNHPDCKRYQDWKDVTEEAVARFVEEVKDKTLDDDTTQLAVCLKSSGELIGDLYFTKKDRTITIGYTLSYKYHRKGYGREVVGAYVDYLHQKFPDYEVVALTYPENIASIRLLEQLNFFNEGYLKELDSIVFSKYTTKKTKVAFVCTHNSCRSQIAEALCKAYAHGVIECYSAGTHPSTAINADAVRLLKLHYGIDMSATQSPKLIQDIPPVEIVITMGCNVDCPVIPCKLREDWGLDDPSGKSDEEFLKVIKTIEKRVKSLIEMVKLDGNLSDIVIK